METSHTCDCEMCISASTEVQRPEGYGNVEHVGIEAQLARVDSDPTS